MVSSLWPPEVLGGAELHAAALADRLRAAGHTVGVVTTVVGDGVVAQIPPWGYPLVDYAEHSRLRRVEFHLGDIARPDAGRAMARAIVAFAPDVVHSHTVQGMSAAVLTRVARTGIAHVHTVHDYWLLCQRNTMVAADDTACTTRCRTCRAIGAVRAYQLGRYPPDVVLAVSAAVARPHEAVLPWIRDRIRVLYNPVELVPGRSRPARPPGAPITFGFLGQVAAVKGIRTLVRAFARAGLEDSRLVVAGKGTDVDAVRGERIEYRGWVDAAGREELFSEVDALVVPSEWQDPAPLVVNEARARGIPVIGAEIGGIPELVAPEWMSLVFPAGDADALADRMRAFASDPDRFAAAPAAAPLDWAGHLEGVLRAYDDAQDGVTTAERGRG